MVPLALFAIAAGFVLASKRKSSKGSNLSKQNIEECKSLTTSGGNLAGIDYLEIVTGGADSNARLPMIISLHGLGYDNTAHVKWLEELQVPARVILPNAFYTQSGNEKKRTWWTSYSNSRLQEASARLAQFVYLIQQCRPAAQKTVITGHSMGGYIALDFSTQFPELISASVPVAATRSSALWDIEPGVPVHAVHGKLDNSFNSGASYYSAMSQRGLPVYLTVVDNGAHRLASANAEAWRSVLSHLVS